MHVKALCAHSNLRALAARHLSALLAGCLLALCLSASTGVHSQLINFSATDAPLTKVFAAVEQQTGYVFFYDENILGDSRPVTIRAENMPLESFLDKILKDEPLKFSFQNKTIIISRKQPEPPAVAARQDTTTHPEPGQATVRGRIVDFETSQPLPGATVTLMPGALSVQTDEKGYYTIHNVPAGSYLLTISYVGYQKNSLPVTVKNKKASVMDVQMTAGTNLGEVVVQAGARKVKAVTHTTEKALIAEIRNATGVVSGISSELINKTADRNAAEVVKRISGINVVDNRFVVVRGMNERYTITYLNDNIAPSTELYSKAFAYDLLPTSIIDRILVYKSPRADLNGEFAGAAVKVFTKNAMPVKHFDIGVQFADRPGSTMTTVNSYNGGKYDFLGLDDGTRKLPSFSPGYFQSDKSAANSSQARMVSAFSPTLMYGTEKSTPDMQFYANYYNAWRLGKMHLYDLTSVTYTKETTFYNQHRQTGNTGAYGISGGDLNLGIQNEIGTNVQTTEKGAENVLENLTLKINPQNTIQFKNFFVNDGRRFTGVNDWQANTVPIMDTLLFGATRKKNIILSFQQRLLYSGNLGGYHHWGQDHRQELDWNAGYTHDMQNVPDQRISNFQTGLDQDPEESPNLTYTAAGSNLGDYTNGFLGMISRLFVKNQENIYNGSLDYTFRVSPSIELKAGTFQEFKTKDVGRRFFRVNRGGLAPGELMVPSSDQTGGAGGWPWGYGLSNPNIINWRLQDLSKIWNPANFPQDGSGLWLYDGTTPVDSYVATEQNNAGYLMGDWNPLGRRFTINAGVRVEYDEQKLAGANTPGGTIGATSNGVINVVYTDHPQTSVLPSVNLTWRPDSVFVIRTGYGRTVDRPDFRELTPYSDYDFINQEVITGNPGLVTATIDNYDLRAEFYPRSAQENEMVDVGVFYKHLQNPIERFRTSQSGYIDGADFTSISFLNAQSAEVYGLEAEVKKSLSFVPGGLFRHLSLVLNGSLIHSMATERPSYVFNSSTAPPGRPLQGQAPYVFNSALFYENPASGTKIGVIYNVTGAIIYAKSAGFPGPYTSGDSSYLQSIRPDLAQLPMNLMDLSISQRIFKSLQMKFSIQNLLSEPYRIIEDQNYNQRYDAETPANVTYNGKTYTYYKGDDLFEKYNPGRYYILSFTYAF